MKINIGVNLSEIKLKKQDTGLEYILDVRPDCHSTGARVKVYETKPPGNNISYSITKTPKIVAGTKWRGMDDENIVNWIIKYRTNLLKVWNDSTLTTQQIHKLLDIG